MIRAKNIFIDLVLVVLTGGLWNLWMQYRQIRDYNSLTAEDRYSFWKWLVFTILTLGLYHIYHEYILTRDLYRLSGAGDDLEVVAIVAAVLSATGLWVFVDIYQQILLNRRIDNLAP